MKKDLEQQCEDKVAHSKNKYKQCKNDKLQLSHKLNYQMTKSRLSQFKSEILTASRSI